jgi:hypothetical protein
MLRVAFVAVLIIYTPSLSLPLGARGRGLSLMRMCGIFARS